MEMKTSTNQNIPGERKYLPILIIGLLAVGILSLGVMNSNTDAGDLSNLLTGDAVNPPSEVNDQEQESPDNGEGNETNEDNQEQEESNDNPGAQQVSFTTANETETDSNSTENETGSDDEGSSSGSGSSDSSSGSSSNGNSIEIRMHETVKFDAGSSQGENIESYHWDFGDGSTGSGQKVSHVYNEAGTYEVTLTVTDSEDNKDVSSKTVEVGE